MNTVSAVCTLIEYRSFTKQRIVLNIYGSPVPIEDRINKCHPIGEMVAVNTESIALDRDTSAIYYKHLCHFRTKADHVRYTAPIDFDDFDLDMF